MQAPRSYAVAAGLLAGAYPDSSAAVDSLERRHVSLFVDLTHPSDPVERYERWLVRSRRIGHPIADMGTPTVGLMIRILDDIDAALAAGDTVYVHCLGGIGRTGTVIGCWLGRHGLDEGDAVSELAKRRDATAGFRRSPETAAQIGFVRGWRRGL